MTDASQRVAVIGAGPAGLMAAEMLAQNGFGVDVYEAMPSPARKFLMAGKSGLNITHTSAPAPFEKTYPGASKSLVTALQAFGPDETLQWMEGLSIGTHIGPTGRAFPVHMKASPLLRAWLERLQTDGVKLHTHHKWMGWEADGAHQFQISGGVVKATAAATVFALGGGSWRRLGSTGEWRTQFETAGIDTSPFRASNCGFMVDWSDKIKSQYAGHPVKNVTVTVAGPEEISSREEFVLTERGVESGAIFSLSSLLRDQLEQHTAATLYLDLAPDISKEHLADRLQGGRGKQSFANYLRKAANLKGVKRGLLFELGNRSCFENPETLAALIKKLQLQVTGTAPLDEAISTAGGVSWNALNDQFMIRQRSGVFCAGEMIDWDAPTGGFLLTACLATGRAAGLSAAQWLKTNSC